MTRGSGAVGIASFDYAKKVQVLIKLITELRALGAQADIDLPRIAVIGNQSAGKSSLVEAISGISVPRAAGTCTRCPMECRLTYSPSPFKCQVLLRVEKDENGNRLPEVKEEKFGPVLHDKGQLENMLRRAQLAILNPSLPAENFVDLDLSKLMPGQKPAGSIRQLQFSSNIVCMDLSSPEVTDLSFIDLPGIISNVSEGEDPRNIELVKNLVKEHISGNALILLTITMRDDIQNQSAALLAKEKDPYGLRTIGVLTKPDTLQEGEHQPWLSVLAGREHTLHHGYYVTKQPAVKELNEKLDHCAAREREQTYFSNNFPWNVSESHIKSRLGVPNLTKELSRLLSQLIESTLPKLRADSKHNLDKCLQELQSLPPPPPENPISELLRLVSCFTADLSSYVWGSPAYESLIQCCRPAYEEFMKDILKTGPNFVAEVKKIGTSKGGSSGKPPGVAAEPAGTVVESPSAHDRQEILDSMEVSPKSAIFGDVSFNKKMSAPAQPAFGVPSSINTNSNSLFSFGNSKNSSTASGGEFVLVRGGFNTAQPSNNRAPFLFASSGTGTSAMGKQVEAVDDEFRDVAPKRAPMYLNEVRDFINSSLTRQLPLTVPHEAKVRLIEQCFEEWPVLSEKCFNVVHAAFRDCLDELVSKIFQRYTNGGLCEHVRNTVERELEKARKQTLERLFWIIGLESPPFTQNEHYFVDYKGKYLAQYRKQRGVATTPSNADVNKALASLTELGFAGVTALDLQKLHGPDVYEQELNLMAEVRAYFRVTYKRIIDNIPRVIDHEFLHEMRKNIQAALIKELGMGEQNSSQRAAAYLSEEPRYVVRREELLQTKERLEGVLEKLYKFTI